MESKVKAYKTKSPPKKSSPSKKAEEPNIDSKKNDVKKILLHTLNIIPHVLFVIVNIVKRNKFAVLPTVAFIKNFIDSNYSDLKDTTDNKPLLEKSKKFVKKFAEVFLIAYSKTALIDKGLMLTRQFLREEMKSLYLQNFTGIGQYKLTQSLETKSLPCLEVSVFKEKTTYFYQVKV